MNDNLINDIIQWDVKSWSHALQYWEEKINWNEVNNCLEIGANKGGLSLWLALKGKKEICSDYKDVETNAKPLHSKYNVLDFIIYENIDALHLPYENFFDIIVFKSIIPSIGRNNNIERQKLVFSEAHKALKKGGKLLFAENLTATVIHKFARKHFVKWGNSCRYININEVKNFLGIFNTYEIKTTGVISAFGRNESQRQILANIDDALFNKICPDTWKYIIYGIAEK